MGIPINKRQSLPREQIIVLKASSSHISAIILNQIYASAIRPDTKKRSFKKFVILGPNDILGTRVYAIGTAYTYNISRISLTSKVLSVFNSSDYDKWNWEYALSNIIDLRTQLLTLDDVFLSKDIDEIVRHTQQFTYVDILKTRYNNLPWVAPISLTQPTLP